MPSWCCRGNLELYTAQELPPALSKPHSVVTTGGTEVQESTPTTRYVGRRIVGLAAIGWCDRLLQGLIPRFRNYTELFISCRHPYPYFRQVLETKS